MIHNTLFVWLKALYLSIRWLKTLYVTAFMVTSIRAWRTWSWVSSRWEKIERNVEPCSLGNIFHLVVISSWNGRLPYLNNTSECNGAVWFNWWHLVESWFVRRWLVLSSVLSMLLMLLLMMLLLLLLLLLMMMTAGSWKGAAWCSRWCTRVSSKGSFPILKKSRKILQEVLICK